MSELKKLPKQIQWALCAYEMFRRLEFGPEDIFFGCDGQVIYAQVNSLEETFVWGEDANGMTQEEFVEIWPKATDLWNNSSNEDALDLFESSGLKERSLELITAMIKKGITPPFMYD